MGDFTEILLNELQKFEKLRELKFKMPDTEKFDFSKFENLETLEIEAGEGNMSEILFNGNFKGNTNKLKEV